MGLASSIEKKVRKKVVGEVEDWVEDRLDDVGDKFEDLADEVKAARSRAERAHDRMNWYANGGIITKVVEQGDEYVLEQVRDKITDMMLDGIEDALGEAADIIEILAPDTYTLVFGVELALVIQVEVTVSLTIPNPVARLSVIRAWAQSPPSGRATIMDCVRDFGPESVTVEAKVSGNGGAATWLGESKYDKIDRFLERHGVN